jgi:hypothetical protein
MTKTIASQETGPHAYSLRIGLMLMFSEDPEQVGSPGEDALPSRPGRNPDGSARHLESFAILAVLFLTALCPSSFNNGM